MVKLETNIFPIMNLAELSSDYRLYRIKGLNPDQSEYYQNCQYLNRKLRYLLKKPITIIERESIPYVVVRADAKELPSPFPLVRTAVIFELCPGILQLDYSLRSPENDEICLRFLQFMLQDPLHSHSDLWQPGAGQPLFKKEPLRLTQNLLQYSGFTVRAVVTPTGGLGLCVDVTSKYVSPNSLPTRISRDEFAKWKNIRCIYHYGHQWYEIQVNGLDDRNVTEYLVLKDDNWIPLLDLVVRESKNPIPPELAQVPYDASVIIYRNNQEQDRAAPSPLCYPVHGTHDESVGFQHRGTILAPHQRRRMIHQFARHYLSRLKFGDTQLHISQEPVSLTPRMFNVPDYKFGNSKVLSVRGTPSAHHTSLDNLRSVRLALLKDKEVGFFNTDPLDRQYFILPQSVSESFGTRFLKDLCHTVLVSSPFKAA